MEAQTRRQLLRFEEDRIRNTHYAEAKTFVVSRATISSSLVRTTTTATREEGSEMTRAVFPGKSAWLGYRPDCGGRHGNKILHGGQQIVINQKTSAVAGASMHGFEADGRDSAARTNPSPEAGEAVNQDILQRNGHAILAQVGKAQPKYWRSALFRLDSWRNPSHGQFVLGIDRGFVISFGGHEKPRNQQNRSALRLLKSSRSHRLANARGPWSARTVSPIRGLGI
jgi:hypothetical protein